ncbi:MAG: serine/threonine protein phosphatase [Alphaproteobacteria bacterium HGW-Alphaproteobacteria-13]|nr:MAG: serine/threonine protein phosphatase [Alphaproteobacteria bacterium HGW-Alphaproteobacteria-13]
MFWKRQPKSAHSASRIFSVPAGRRVYAIGDIHGRDDLFALLIERIEQDSAARGPMPTTLILLGDLVDRGPESAAVVERARQQEGRWDEFHWITGNHEEAFLLALSGDLEALKFFSRYGGEETILSYGLDQDALRRMDWGELAAILPTLVPPEHHAFLNDGKPWVRLGDYLFVHAGIRPGVEIENQKLSDLRWIRQPFLDDTRDHGVYVVHGHTITKEPEHRGNRLGIDTGAYASNRLTAVGLEGDQIWFCTAESIA